MTNEEAQCYWFYAGNGTEPRVKVRLDSAGCLFQSIMPNTKLVPALVCVFLLLTLFSFVVNGFTLFRIGRSEDLSWEPRFTFLKNLILSDLIQTTTISPAVIYSLVQRRTMEFSAWCYLQYFAGTASIFASFLTITCMALERYLYVCHAIHYLVIITKVRLRLTLSFIWLFSISVACTNVVLLHTGRTQGNGRDTRGLLCEPDVMEQHMGFPRASAIFRKVVGLVTLLLCLVVYAFSYLRMYQDARNAVIPFNTTNSTARKTVLYYCCMLFLQLLPLLAKAASDAVWEIQGTVAMEAQESSSSSSSLTSISTSLSTASAASVKRSSTFSTTAAGFHLTLLILLVVPPCINPLVYLSRSAEMRKALRSLFQWWTEKRGLVEIRMRNVEDPNRARAA
ncbi:olfactory receptor 2G3 isoform X1 [Cynoglossus semilaevis]|uniref:olfactory receptor 2G3 isoform X1 n=2 Tax=Cynoglossus semilaevis TaxID=244447 RepID=UPI000D62E848|nr:olfactory receptor 2G3-like isoform X1 [Cynoglossus semilaevis]